MSKITDFIKNMTKNNPNLPTSIISFGGKEEGLSIQGASHIKHNKVCQDFGGHYRCDDFAVAVVCDGHGGDAYFRSDRGSKWGVEIAIDSIKEFMNSKKEFLKKLSGSGNQEAQSQTAAKAMEQLVGNIISRWSDAVSQDFRQNPFTSEELNGLSDKYKQRYAGEDDSEKISAYGSTLIAVVYAPEFWFGIRNGDGRCVSVSADGSICDPIPWNEKCFLNRTTSLCDEKAFENFRHCFSTGNFPVAIYVGTDGIDDSFGADERLFGFYKRLTETFYQSGFEGGKQELKEYLPKLTTQGSGDDVSISGIVDLERIKGLFIREKETEKVSEMQEIAAETTSGNAEEKQSDMTETIEVKDSNTIISGENTNKNDG
jgi:hypothetical protein